MTDKNYYISRFPAETANLRQTISDVMAYYGSVFRDMDDASSFELKVVLNELLINSVKHGGGRCGAGFIKIVAGFMEDDCAMIIIEDEGDGYDTTLLRDNGAAGAGEKRLDDVDETGRGIFIVKNLCDEFMVNEKGNKVVVSKKLRRRVIA